MGDTNMVNDESMDDDSMSSESGEDDIMLDD